MTPALLAAPSPPPLAPEPAQHALVLLWVVLVVAAVVGVFYLALRGGRP